MLYLVRSALLFIILVVGSALTSAQGFRVEGNSPPTPLGADTFTSLEGRFTISLPAQVAGFKPQSGNTPNGRVEGVLYDWRTEAGVFMVGYIDGPRVVEATSKAAFDTIRNTVLSTNGGKGTLTSEKDITLQGHPGRELRIEFPDGFGVLRLYAVGNRIYQAIASLSTAKKAQEPTAVKILDSFKLLTQDDVQAELKRKVAAATPSPLPQEPVAKRPKSDAEDEGLKGRVQTIFTEDEDLSGTWSVSKRKPSSMKYYNERGNLTKHESYDYRGNPMDITVYGYLDGDRASDRESIRYEYDPPAMVIDSAPGEPKPKYDPRYTYKFKFKYDDKGHLLEQDWYGNSGKLWLRYVYKYDGNKREELVYSEDGSLNQRYMYTLDDKGHEIEETAYEAKDGSIRDKYSYAYEFDAQGNWIKRTTSKWVTKGGQASYQPAWVDYRMITYYGEGVK
ncbi:MAG: hypothetical protein ACJ74W_13285 [Pyrinomonadaceae bacterium]